jgi:hypothetical protein
MIKSLSALAIVLLLGASAITLSGFAPRVGASEVAVLAKADRLEIRVSGLNCATQVWPDIAPSCLRTKDSGVRIPEARLVIARR